MASSDMWISNEDGVFEDPPPKLAPEPQDHSKATFTKKIEKENGLLDLSADGYQNYLKFCAYDEWPGTHFFAEKNGKKVRVKIADASFKDGIFTPVRVTPEGKKEMVYEDFLRGV
jgi:methionyl-tRNA formyltransferase